MAYDKAVEADKKTEYDLPPDKAKIAQKFAHAGTRKAPTAYKFTPRQRVSRRNNGVGSAYPGPTRKEASYS